MQLQWRDVRVEGGQPISTSLTTAEAAELRKLAQGARVLEIGAAFGYSAVVMAQVATHVTSVDPHQWLNSRGEFIANMSFYGVTDRVHMIVDQSSVAVPALADAGERFDLIFIDGDHGHEAVAQDIRLALTVLEPTGTLAMHDLDELTCPGVRLAVHDWRVPDRVVDTLALFYGPYNGGE